MDNMINIINIIMPNMYTMYMQKCKNNYSNTFKKLVFRVFIKRFACFETKIWEKLENFKKLIFKESVWK